MRCAVCKHEFEEGSVWQAEGGQDFPLCRGCEVRRSKARIDVLVMDDYSILQRFTKRAPELVVPKRKAKVTA